MEISFGKMRKQRGIDLAEAERDEVEPVVSPFNVVRVVAWQVFENKRAETLKSIRFWHNVKEKGCNAIQPLNISNI